MERAREGKALTGRPRNARLAGEAVNEGMLIAVSLPTDSGCPSTIEAHVAREQERRDPMGAAAQRLDQGKMTFERVDSSTLVVHLSGPWHLQRDLPPISLLRPNSVRGRAPGGSLTKPPGLRIGTAG